MTLTGVCQWAKVWKPGMYQGKPTGYSIDIKLDSPEKEEALKQRLLQYWEDHKEEALTEANGNKKKFKPNMDEIYLGTPAFSDGDETWFKAKRAHVRKNKATGEMEPVVIPIFNKHGEIMQSGTLIGNGSRVQVNVIPTVFAMSRNNFGVSLKIMAICVHDLVAYSKDAASYGFNIEDDSEDPEFTVGSVDF